MIFNKTIQLISVVYTQDDIGQQIEMPSYRKAYVALRSVPQSEFFAAGETNIKPSAVFVIRTGEYKKETKLRYPATDSGTVYTIYRTYDTTDEMTELYCEVRTGG